MVRKSPRREHGENWQGPTLNTVVVAVRWLAVPLAFVNAVVADPPPISRPVGGGVAVALSLYNLAATLSPRMGPRMRERVVAAALIGDLTVVSIFMFLYSRYPADLSWAFLMLVGAEAAALYRWRGVAWILPPMVAVNIGISWEASSIGNLAGLLDMLQKVLEVVGVTVIMGSFADRSERGHRQLVAAREELVLKNAELELASRLKSEFLANMSHELRTPLNSIMGFTQMLGRSEINRLTDRGGRYLGNIDSSSRHLLQLIDEILDLSKIEAGRLTVETEAMTLEPIVGQVIATLGPLAEATSLVLDVQLEAGSEPFMADSLRVRQVITNLVSNAIKFTPQGSIRIGCRLVGDMIELDVADTGIGIVKEAQGRVFDEFIQAEASTTRRFGGTGLGLAISRKLVEMMGGTIGLESVPGKGSRFWFRLPIQGVEARGSHGAAGPNSVTPVSKRAEAKPSGGSSHSPSASSPA